MPNRTSIDTHKRINMRTGSTDYTITVYDDFYEAILIFAEKSDIPNDEMEILQLVNKIRFDEDGDYGESIYDIQKILLSVEEDKRGITLGDTPLKWEDIKDTIHSGILPEA